MKNMDKVLQAISIGIIVASFLFNTNRFLKSIEICKECLAILKRKAGIKDDKLTIPLYKVVYMAMSNAYRAINDNTNAIKFTEKTLQIYRESREKLLEYKLSFHLACLFFIELRTFLTSILDGSLSTLLYLITWNFSSNKVYRIL